MDDDDAMMSKDFTIKAMNELRVEINDQPISIVLQEGIAEIFGNVLIKNVEYKDFALFSGLSIFTSSGCIITIIGMLLEMPYSPSQLPNSLIQCINLHTALHKSKNTKLMIVGPSNVGKMTMCHHLLNYAARELLTTQNKPPVFIDLNVERNRISSLPGTIGCGFIDKNKPIWDLSTDLIDYLSLHFGAMQVKKNLEFFKSQCFTLHNYIKQKTKEGGMIILTPNKHSIGDQDYYNTILELSKIFQIDCLVVMGDEALYQKFEKDPQLDVGITVKNINKWEGSIEKKLEDRKFMQQFAIKNYFRDFLPLSKPHFSRIDELSCVRIVSSELTKAVLPIGKERMGTDCFHQELVSDTNLNFSIASIVEGESNEESKEQSKEQSKDYDQPILGFAKILDSNPTHISISTIGDLPFSKGALMLMDYKAL